MGNLGEYVFKKEGEVMAMNLSPNIFYISSCGDKCNCPLVDALSSSSFYENCGNADHLLCCPPYVFVGPRRRIVRRRHVLPLNRAALSFLR
jgi:hypothetical protein